jgi:hypothetical protein
VDGADRIIAKDPTIKFDIVGEKVPEALAVFKGQPAKMTNYVPVLAVLPDGRIFTGAEVDCLKQGPENTATLVLSAMKEIK